ncbi:hypothetical protein KFE25_008821 [Diacronema lutheri]|uniref:NAD-dependent epimerase/dehydratase domain-containing protein n=2 Tax=Diacronema lutheri TaxID=2081491 RepID=A0A8J5XYS1_DIALT|nr:hypothetical protein KFE25_008821 [Diacronema lutheri]
MSSVVAKNFGHAKWHLGRSSNSGVTATVFGAYGFIGRYIVNRLARSGARVVVPYRGDDYDVKHLKVMGDLGQIVPYEMSIRSYEQMQQAVAGSNVVINLLGKPFETNRFDFDQINVHFPRALGAICTELGVDRVVHMSALGASSGAPSKWLRTKFLGEAALHEEFPNATILRLATVVGMEEKFMTKTAELAKMLPLTLQLGSPTAKQQPVYCLDVAAAVQAVLMREEALGQTYAIAGPRVYTNDELYDFIFKTIRRPKSAVVLPLHIQAAIGSLIGMMPKPLITRHMVQTMTADLTAPSHMPGLRELGIAPTPMEEVALQFLKRFRPPGSQTVEELSKLPYNAQNL